MILVTRLNGEEIHLNPDLILSLETTPDTVVTMTTGDKFILQESAQEVTARFMDFKRAIGRINGSRYSSRQ